MENGLFFPCSVPGGRIKLKLVGRRDINSDQNLRGLTDAQSSTRYANSYYRPNCDIINPDPEGCSILPFGPQRILMIKELATIEHANQATFDET